MTPDGYPGYRVLRELEPLGGVRRLVALDLGLDRPVELHALATEAPTPERVAEFRRRAGMLARLNHPGIAPIHRIENGAGGGDVHYVVPHFPQDSLAARLARGPLPHATAVQLANDLLPAIVAAHVAGVVGGELDPTTIACVEGRWVATALGIARSVPGSRWVAPEEHGGGVPSGASDIFVAGQLLREAFGPASRRVAPVLARATASAPADRWPDAATFRSACRQSTRRRRWKRPLLAAVGLAAAYWLVARMFDLWPYAEPPPHYRLAIVPFVVGTNKPDTVAGNLAGVIQYDLDGVPGLRLASGGWVLKRLKRNCTGSTTPPEQVTAALVRCLRTEWVAHGRVDRQGQAVGVSVSLYDREGDREALAPLSGKADDLDALGDTVSRLVLAAVARARVAGYVPRPELQGVPLAALKSFLQGEEAFELDEHTRAAGFYEDALKEDSTFALAEWRLANVQRWRRLPSKVDLPALYRRAGDRLGKTDRRLLEALAEPDLPRRFAILDSVLIEDPDDAYARLIYGEELWHRGPLLGMDVTEALEMMERAVAADSALSQAYDHIIMYHIREGDWRAAWQAFGRKARVTLRPAPPDLDTRRFLRLALHERFIPRLATLAHVRLRLWHDSTDVAGLARVARLATPWLDLPWTQTQLSEILLAIGPTSDSARASAHTGIALGLLARGKLARGLAELDQATDLSRTAEMRLQQIEWRVIPPALGFRGWDSGNRQAWLDSLKRFTADPVFAARARWALALGRLGLGDTVAFRGLVQAPPATVEPLGVVLRAIGASVREQSNKGEQFRTALAIADSARQAVNVTTPPDPFATAALHLFEGDWKLALGDSSAADGHWLWYLAAEFEGWPNGPPQAGEVDGVLGMLARSKRAELRLATAKGAADSVAACAAFGRLRQVWSDADTSLRWMAQGVNGFREACH